VRIASSSRKCVRQMDASSSIIIDDDRQKRRRSSNSSSSSQPAHGILCVECACQQVQVASSRSCSSQSTSRVTAMTPRPADVTISRRFVDGRNVKQSLRRRRQPRSASVASTLMMTLVLVFITCDTGQPVIIIIIIIRFI